MRMFFKSKLENPPTCTLKKEKWSDVLSGSPLGIGNSKLAHLHIHHSCTRLWNAPKVDILEGQPFFLDAGVGVNTESLVCPVHSVLNTSKLKKNWFALFLLSPAFWAVLQHCMFNYFWYSGHILGTSPCAQPMFQVVPNCIALGCSQCFP